MLKLEFNFPLHGLGADVTHDCSYFLLENSWKRLKIPDMFARALDGQQPRYALLQESISGQEIWEAEVLFDGDGRMFLTHGWEQFAVAYGLQHGFLLMFRHRGGPKFSIKIFDRTMCRRLYYPIVRDES